MSRFVAIAAAVALVVSGVVIGALGTFLALQRTTWQDARRPPGPMPPPPHRGPFTREMEMRLDLSDEQMEKIHDILKDSREASDALRRELRPRLEAQLEKTWERIGALLNPDQRAKFEKMIKEDRRRAERFFIDGPPPPPPGGPPPPPPPPWDGPPPPSDGEARSPYICRFRCNRLRETRIYTGRGTKRCET
jgi:hypothetical protein